MKRRILSAILLLCIMITLSGTAFADQTQKAAVFELYSVDGYYQNSLGNQSNYSYHVPQLNADSSAAKEINDEIGERFGSRVEAQFKSMEGGYSLWTWHTEWQSFWNGSQIFLFITSDEDGDCNDYAAYGYDFNTGERVTNEMILAQRGISEEEYLEKLKEAVQLKFEEIGPEIPEGVTTKLTREKLLEQTLSWQDLEQPMFIDQYGEIETIVRIVSIAGAGWYYHLVSPFAGQNEGEPTYRISIIGDTDLVESCPESAKAGETVTVSILDATDGDIQIQAIGVEGTRNNWFEYQFVMPDHDVDVKVEFIDYGLA